MSKLQVNQVDTFLKYQVYTVSVTFKDYCIIYDTEKSKIVAAFDDSTEAYTWMNKQLASA